jgi:hypothetical protein
LGPREINNINQMITISKSIICLTYLLLICGLGGQFDHISWMTRIH